MWVIFFFSKNQIIPTFCQWGRGRWGNTLIGELHILLHHSLSLSLFPLSLSHSTKQTSYSSRKKAVTHKRHQNQNAEISELASLVPLCMLPPSVEDGQAAGPLVPSNGTYNSPAMDKLSVLRLVSTYLKLQQFMKDSKLMFVSRFIQQVDWPSLRWLFFASTNVRYFCGLALKWKKKLYP